MTAISRTDLSVRPSPVIYPETDGRPMGETELHRDEAYDLIKMLQWHFRDEPDVHVTGNLFVYYEEAIPSSVFCPDVFVARGVDKQRRRTYKLWEEGVPPTVVFEVTSRATRLEDVGKKRALCAELGVAEYYLYDPEDDYLDPPLQGFRLAEGRSYEPAIVAAAGALVSDALGLSLRLVDGLIELRDARSGEALLRPDEVHRSAAIERDRRERAEHEVARLRAEVERLRRDAGA
jgi:Uma2 family endonuclease